MKSEWDGMFPAQRDAAMKILELYKELYFRPGWDTKELKQRWMKNPHELLAYGMTNPELTAKLMQTEGTFGAKFTNAAKQLWDYITIMLGVKKGSRVDSALAELMVHGNTLIKYSSGKGLSIEEQGALKQMTPETFAKGRTEIATGLEHVPTTAIPKTMVEVMESLGIKTPDQLPDVGTNKFSKWWYGFQQFGQMVQHNPLLHNTLSTLKWADNKGTQFENYVLHGEQTSAARKRFGPLVSLGKIDSGQSVPVLANTLPIEDWAAVMPIIHKAGQNRMEHSDALKLLGGNLTDKQKLLHTALADYANRVREFENKEIFGKPFGYSRNSDTIAYHAGWFPAVRKGDYDIVATYNGLALYAGRVRTEIEAKDLVKKMKVDPRFKGLDIEFIDRLAQHEKEVKMPEMRKEQLAFADRLDKRGEYAAAAAIRQTIEEDIRRGGPLGGHAMRRHGVPGHEGMKAYQTTLEQVREFRQSYLDYAHEGKNLIVKKLVNDALEPIHNNPILIENYPNAVAISKHLSDMMTNNFTAWTTPIDKGVRNFVDNVVVKAAHLMGAKDWYPSAHAFDRTTGVMAHLFYINTLTSRPGFWLAQALTSTSAVRAMFRTDNTVDAFVSMGKGMTTVMTGGNKDFHEALNYVAANLNTMHPQLINELNSIGFRYGEKAGSAKYAKMLQAMAPWATGEKIGATADAFSRYASFAMFYEKYKAQGLKGEALWKAAASDTDSTMVQYSNPYRAPVIRKLGIVGDMVAPLQTFATAQLGNLHADLKYIGQQKSLKSVLPFLATGMTTMLMGGAIGLPFVVEYEALRQMMIWVDPSFKDMPSIMDVMNQEEQMEAGTAMGVPRGSMTYGLPSAVSGYDVGSGLRWNQVVTKVLSEGENVMSLFPAVEFGRSVAANLVTMFREEYTDQLVRDAEYRKAVMSLSGFIVGGKSLADRALFGADERDFVPGGSRGYAQRPQTPEEGLSTVIGSGTLRAKQDQTADRVLRAEEKLRNEQRQKAVDVLLDGITGGKQSDVDKSIDKLSDLGLTNKQINEQLEAAYGNRNIPQRERFYVSGRGKVSRDGERKFMQQQRFGVPQ
jgi:hypothetical protein